MDQQEVLTVSHLRTVFGNGTDAFTAVEDLSFTLKRGQTLGIVGESGSGKSVTSLSLMRLTPEPPVCTISGSVILDRKSGGNADLLTLPLKELRHSRGNDIAMIFQEPMTSLNPVFTCGFQVAESIMLHTGADRKTAREKSIALFTKVKLPRAESMFDSYPHELSGGQKQRVMIAMAIACNPRVLIADEPTTALDVSVQASILELLAELQSETGMGMIFITHDLGVISRIADHILVMYKGRVVEQGNADKIFMHPEHPYTKGLLACRPANHTGLSRLPVISDFMKADSAGNMSETGLTIDQLVSSLRISPQIKEEKRALMYSKEPILQVKNLTTAYRLKTGWFKPAAEVRAVDQVSFDVYPGETLGLVGESGCGKTTLGRSILRLIEPTSGEVLYNGRDIRKYDQRELRGFRKHMQLIFQDPYSSLNPRMTAGQAIIEPMTVHNLHGSAKARKQKVMELLTRVGLREEHYYRYPHQFSGGQRQRICIARALSLNPSFLICDESVSALDVSVQAQVLNLLNELKEQEGLTFIFISHDLSVVRYMSDRMMVMNKGKIEELGNADEVYTNPASEYTRKLIAAIPA